MDSFWFQISEKLGVCQSSLSADCIENTFGAASPSQGTSSKCRKLFFLMLHLLTIVHVHQKEMNLGEKLGRQEAKNTRETKQVETVLVRTFAPLG